MKLPLMLRLRSSVLHTIWWQILLVVLYTTGVLLLHKYELWRIEFPQTLIPVLGVVTGLLLVFRTNTAYDRFYEGRKVWSTMTLNIRTMARCIWVMVKDPERVEGGASTPPPSEHLVEKISAINLLVGFAYATKNYLRREVVAHCPECSSGRSHHLSIKLPTLSHPIVIPLSCPTKHGGKPAKPPTRQTMSRRKDSSQKRKEGTLAREGITTAPTNVPLELSYYLAAYINSVAERNLADRPVMNMMNGALSNLVDCLGRFERILETPIPLAYSIHLHHVTWVYLLALPFQLDLNMLDWFAIPAVGLAAFALLGILSIGGEIENPFGYDANDLPLDSFCNRLFVEISKITGSKMPPPSAWIMAPDNLPLQPVTQACAQVLATEEESAIMETLAERNRIVTVGMSNPNKSTSTPTPIISKGVDNPGLVMSASGSTVEFSDLGGGPDVPSSGEDLECVAVGNTTTATAPSRRDMEGASSGGGGGVIRDINY